MRLMQSSIRDAVVDAVSGTSTEVVEVLSEAITEGVVEMITQLVGAAALEAVNVEVATVASEDESKTSSPPRGGKRGKGRRRGGKKSVKKAKVATKATLPRRFQLAAHQAEALVSEQLDGLMDALEMSGDLTDVTAAIVEALQRHNVVRAADDDGFDVILEDALEADTDGDVTEGAEGVALLTEDDAWHEAVVTEVLGEDEFIVTFVEYGKPQKVARKQFVLQADRVDVAPEPATCPMCSRQMPLTAHHLIPRQMHERYKKKGLTQDFLNTCADICRPCHSAVHRFQDNATLAAKYNTLELLLDTEYIQRWVSFASKQKAKSRRDVMAGCHYTK